MVRGKKLHALIWWVDSAYKDVVSLTVFPKAQRKVDAVATLSWKDYQTGKTTKTEAKILAISADTEELNRIVVTESGETSQPSNKVVSASVIKEKKRTDQHEKLKKSIKMSNDRKLANVITSLKPIFPTSKQFCQEIDPACEQVTEIHVQTNATTPSCPAEKSKPTFTPSEQFCSGINPAYQQTREIDKQPNAVTPSRPDDKSEPAFPSGEQFRRENNPAYQQMQEYHKQSHVMPPSWPADKPHTITRQIIESQYPQQSFDTNQSAYPTSGYSKQQMMMYNPQVDYWTSNQSWTPAAGYKNVTAPGLFPDHRYVSLSGPSAIGTQGQRVPPSISHGTQKSYQEPIPVLHDVLMPESSTTADVNSDIEIDIENNEDDTNDEDSSSTSSTIAGKENSEGAVKAMAATFPGKIGKRDIAFQELLLAAMKYSYKVSNAVDYKSTETLKIADHFLKPGSNMEEISPNCGFYMHKEKLAYVHLVSKTENSYDWRIIVREVLLDIYGTTLANHSAVGKRGERPPINTQLFRGLHEWTNRVSGGILRKDFIKYINKCASNKRKHRNQKNKENVSGKRPRKNPKSSQVSSRTPVPVLSDQRFHRNVVAESQVDDTIVSNYQSTYQPIVQDGAIDGSTYTQLS